MRNDSPEMRDLLARQQAERDQARQREQLAHETAEGRRRDWAGIERQLNLGNLDGDAQHRLAIDFAFGSDEQLAGYRIASFAGEAPIETAAPSARPDSVNPYERVLKQPKSTTIVLLPGQNPPEGFEVTGTNFADLRREGDERRAWANASRARAPYAGIAGEGDVNDGTTVDGFAERVERGQPVAEHRPVPLEGDAELESALGEYPELLDGAPDDLVRELQELAKQHADDPAVLAQVGLTRTIVPGPEGERYEYWRLHSWSPDNPFPTRESHGPGAVSVTARKILQLARSRRDHRLRGGAEVAEFAVRNPFGSRRIR